MRTILGGASVPTQSNRRGSVKLVSADRSLRSVLQATEGIMETTRLVRVSHPNIVNVQPPRSRPAAVQNAALRQHGGFRSVARVTDRALRGRRQVREQFFFNRYHELGWWERLTQSPYQLCIVQVGLHPDLASFCVGTGVCVCVEGVTGRVISCCACSRAQRDLCVCVCVCVRGGGGSSQWWWW